MKRKVAYYETDRMQIVHHSNYIRYMEEARLSWFEEHNLDYHNLESMGIMLPVVSVNAKYKKPLHFGDTFEVETTLTEVTNVTIKLEYVIKNSSNGDVCCIGESIHCFVDNTFKPIALKKVNPQLLNTFKKCLNEK
ncbi:MAG: acyl-CoA thioesterase [Oscillospiraceae bacterium]